jgi:hypothetical protein
MAGVDAMILHCPGSVSADIVGFIKVADATLAYGVV